jgi:hypothetical protein
MKASDKPQLSQKWWDANRPPELKSSPLGRALLLAESALATQRKHRDDADAIDDCLSALEDVAEAADKTVRQCDKTKHKEVIAVLNKYDGLVNSETSRLEAMQKQLQKENEEDDEADDEEANEGKLFDKAYLYKMMKLLKSGGKEFNFAFGLDTAAPDSSRLLLKRKGKPEMLFKALKKTGEFSDRQITYGFAQADPNDGKTLVFRLEVGAGEPPQIEKLGRRFLCSDRALKFRKLKMVLPGGQAAAETDSNKNKKSGNVPA